MKKLFNSELSESHILYIKQPKSKKTIISLISKTRRAGENLSTYLESALKILSSPPIQVLDEKTLLTSVMNCYKLLLGIFNILIILKIIEIICNNSLKFMQIYIKLMIS